MGKYYCKLLCDDVDMYELQDDLDDYDSACELDLETLILDDKDGCITFNTGQ